MQRDSRSGFNFDLFPEHIIIKIMTELLNSYDEKSTLKYNIANIGSIRMINLIIQSDHSKVKIVDFMDTRLWLKLLISTGVFDYLPHTEWCDTIKDYLSQFVWLSKYTSRVHDLIDIFKYDLSPIIRSYAKRLLDNLITKGSSKFEKQFLRGEITNIPRINNTTIRQFVLNTKQLQFIRYWDVRNVTDMSRLFYHHTYNLRTSKFVLDLTYWDTKNVTRMSELMRSVSVNIRGITNWNTCRVEYMDCCFMNAESFNYPIEWNTSNVKTMNGMFFNAKSFNKPLQLDTSEVAYMNSMFNGATSFNQPLYWDTSNVIEMRNMFNGATSFNQQLEWNISRLRYTDGMFNGATSFNQPEFTLKMNTIREFQLANRELVWTGSWGGWQQLERKPWEPPYGGSY